MSSPQLEDGYIRIANELFRAVIGAGFSKRELLIVLAIMDKTYGYGKKTDDITMTQLADITQLNRPHVSATVHALAEKKVLLIRDGKYGKVLGISKNYKKWNLEARTETGQYQNGTRTKTVRGVSQNGTESVPKRYKQRTETGHTKDNPKRQPQKTTPKDSCAAPTAPTWEAYSRAYQERYNTEPVRNAKVNGQLAQFCKRVAAEEAPSIAAYFVTHNNRYYVSRGHSVDCLLSDAEKLRTEWATNLKITESGARQADRTEGQGQVWGKLLDEANAS